ncbi:SMC family ATPase [Streptomyces jumonjinensis]
MRLHRLSVSAFGPFGAAQDIDFDALSGGGIFLLHGPTGAGKTSVLDAVCFALYGAVPGARQSPGASLRSDHAESGVRTEVLLELTAGGRRLEIVRSPAQPRPKKNGKGFTTERAQSRLREWDAGSAAWKALSTSHQEIGEELAQLVGMSRDQFCQVVLLPQGDFARFLRADAEARGRLLGRLFDTRRFAAVEERLAERRRQAEARVRAGDERLLELAHRMEQAAGPVAGDAPPPRQQPGDPGLADAVGSWAAVARSGAYERRDIASLALSTAERRETLARERLDAERELARLQQRYEDAERRRRTLEERRPEYEALCALLERARKAERVAPALGLREDAERDHRAATAARDRVFAQLPADLREAGAEQLLELERRLRQDLGGLESARRAERRVEEIVRERAGLDRQARADDGVLAEAEGWLAGWEALRHEHRERIEAARDAATRAEHLAGRLETARERLGAARERDRLTGRAREAGEALRAARDRAGAARENWLDLKERRLRGIAAELAASLAEGEPCAVCGSSEHPAPASADAAHVAPAEEDAAYEEFTRADRARSAAERERAVVEESLASARARAREAGAMPGAGTESVPAPASAERGDGQGSGTGGRAGGPGAGGGSVAGSVLGDAGVPGPRAGGPDQGTGFGAPERARGDRAPGGVRTGRAGAGTGFADGSPAERPTGLRDGAAYPTGPTDLADPADPADPAVAELESLVARLEREHRDARALASGAHAAREALDRAEREHQERLAARQQAERRASARTSAREALDREQTALAAEVARIHGGAGTVAERAALLERRVRLLAEAAATARDADLTAQGLKDADDRLADAAFKAGFDTPYAAAAARVPDPEQRGLQHRVDAWRTEAAAVGDRLAEPETRAAAERPPAGPGAALAAHETAERALRQAVSAYAAACDRCGELGRLSERAAAESLALGPLREEYDRVARLAGLTAGTSADNERKMRLESYVLAARLEQVAAAATVRLRRMSQGRYSLVHSDARSGGRRSGLGLHVVDSWTGGERDTATLSGGETFFASLALALGLADVVTEEAGGVRLDTLFIDEGFGSLDEQTLDEVIDVLDSLRERDRSVGIVSHVADLRRRIPTQLEVVKQRHGSTVRLRTAPLGG